MRLFFLFLFFTTCFSFSQNKILIDSNFIEKISARESDSLYVDSIIITGNEKTKEYIIRREITFTENSLINTNIIEFNKSRIYSLGLFTKVEPLLYKRNGKNIVEYSVSERWYLFPYPVFGIKYKDWSKLFYGMGLAHTNFLGINQKFFGSFALGYDPWGNLHYFHPDIFYGKGYLFDASINYSRVKNKSENYNTSNTDFYEQWFDAALSIGKRFGFYKYLWYSLGYSYLNIDNNSSKRTISGKNEDNYIYMMISGSLDTRDMAEYPMNGEYISFSFIKMGLGESPVDYSKLNINLKKYIPTNTILGSICFRSFSSFTFGNRIPNYSHNYYGYGERIRGHYFEKWEGENIFGFSSELRIPILKPQYIVIPDMPFPEFSVLRYALSINFFYDLGEVWDRYNFQSKTLKYGFGGGLNFHLPYSVILRMEYAFNKDWKGEIIFDAGVSF